MSALTELRTLLEKRGETMPVTNAGGVSACLVPVATLRALVSVAEAVVGMDTCPFCLEEIRIPGWPVQPHLKWCPLAPLVKEADDE